MKAPRLPLNFMFRQITLSPFTQILGTLKIFLPLILLAACTSTSGDKDVSLPPPLYAQPQKVELKAGVSITATPKIIHPDSVAEPQSFTVDHAALTTINVHPIRHQIPKELTTISVDKSQLKTIHVGEDNQDFVLLSSTGDTIPTGVPIPAKGKVVKAFHSKPTKALPPATKDAAIAHLQYLNVEHGMASSFVRTVLEDKSGNIWVGTRGGVSVYNGESFTHYTENEGLSNNLVRAILEDQYGNIWLGTGGGGVSIYNGESFTHYTENEGLSNNFVLSILEDQNGNIWLGTGGGGVSVYNGESFIHYTESEGLSNNFAWSILEDQSGNIWVGTEGGGVSVFNGESFTHYTKNEGLSNNDVVSIAEDKSGNIWVGTWGGGVNVYDGGSFTHYTKNEGLSNNLVVSILEDQYGNIWLGTGGGGVSVYDGESFTHYTKNEGLSNNSVWSIAEDKSGNIWLGTGGGGVSVYNGESFTHYTENEGLSSNFVFSILEDQSGNIWLGTQGGGVSVYNGESFTHYTENEGLSNNTVWSILEDQSGNIWLGTEGGGVSVFNGESFIHYGENEGVSHNSVFSIIEDKSAPLNEIGVFMGTEKGLSKISLKEDETSGVEEFAFSIQNFGKQDGLKSLRFNPGAIIDSKNRAWWGSGNGLVMLDLNTLNFSDKIPQPQLSQLEINEQFIDYRTIQDSPDNYQYQIKFNGIQKFDNYPLNLQLPYDKNHLTFYFAAIDWAAPHKIRYSYRMKGLNTNWSEPTADPVADYRNLTFGTYNFQIRALGESGVWSEPFDYAFTILPPWWHSWWAYFVYAVLFLNGLYLLRRYELNRFNLKNQLEYERVEKESLRKLDQEKNRFIANISHDFRTPLTLTLGPLQDLRNGAYGKLSANALDQINLAIRNSRRLLRLVGQLMDLTRLENKKFELNMKSGNLSNYLKTLSEPFVPTAKRRGIKFIVDIPQKPIYALFDDKHFDKIIANLLSNAFKFTPRNGTVTLQLAEINGFAEISLRDTGDGISEKHQQQLFERFFQVQKSEKKPGTGIGLSIAKELALLHGSDIYVTSEIGKGSTFTVRISTTKTINKAEIVPVSDTAELQSDIELKREKKTQLLTEISDNESDIENNIRKTILVVDDHADIRSYLRNHLSEIYNVSEATSGTEALSIIINELPDLVISDVMMPDGNGFELLKQIRKNPEINFIPVILLTAKVEAEDKLSGLGIGANEYITKPFNIREVLIRIENLFKYQKRLQHQFKLAATINGHKKIHHDKVKLKSADEIYLDAVKNQIQNHLSNEDFTVEMLAEKMNQSRSNLHRRLTKLTGESPSSMIRRIRIELGAQLLLQNTGTVSEIAYSTGFKSVAHFSRVFREQFDQTPTEYMNSLQ